MSQNIIIIAKQVGELAVEELERTRTQKEPFHSEHEGYAVMLEEYREAKKEMEEVADNMEYLFENIMKDLPGWMEINTIEQRATMAAAEAIQLVAMAKKYKERLDREYKGRLNEDGRN